MTNLAQKYMHMPVRLGLSTGNEHFSKSLSSVRSDLTTALGRGEPRRQAIRMKVSMVHLVHFSKGDLAKKHQSSCVPSRWLAVVGRFTDHVSEVNSFAEHIAC